MSRSNKDQNSDQESATTSGDRFRDSVAALLRAGGYAVQTELLEGHKRVDLIFEDIKFGKRRRYLVEAKNWAKPLNKTDLENIYGGYAALLQRRAADELLIVSPHQLRSPQAKAFVRDTLSVSHLSFNDFQESILGFHDYLARFVYHHERDGLEDYYISPIVDGEVNLEQRVNKWLSDDERTPMAIIASYGMGKTSFARHLTYKLAKQFLSGDIVRIPILVSLGTISREQSLEGLIGSVLAGSNPAVQGYRFPLFAHLNDAGRFIILLDGFDEMKHMMTHAEFAANFDELNKLVTGSSKVLILGRPTAFLSENERESVLRGSKTLGRSRVRTPGAPTYNEVKLLPFSPTQLRSFVQSYLARHKRLGNVNITDELMVQRQQEIETKVNDDLVSRPIHARMIADLATDSEFDIKVLTRFALYDHFVDHLISRELSKTGRGLLHKANDRRGFLCDLAWHLYTEQSAAGMACRIDDLPDRLFQPYLPTGDEVTSIKRDLLAGSFLDEKRGGIFYFSHRSFHEFLVAEYIWSNIIVEYPNDDFINKLFKALTKEVFEFLKERNDRAFFLSLFSILTKIKDGIPIQTLRLLCSSSLMINIASNRNAAHFSTWDAAVLLGNAMPLNESLDTVRLVRLTKSISRKTDRKPTILLASMNAILSFGTQIEAPADVLAPALIILLFSRAETDLQELSRPTDGRSRNDTLRDLIFKSVSADKDKKGNLIMRLDLGELHDCLASAISLPIPRDSFPVSAVGVYEAKFNEFFVEIDTDEQRVIRMFYERDAAIASASRAQENG